MAYLIDTNVFVQAKNFHYNFTICPGFWKWIDYAKGQQLVLSVRQVRDELLRGEDELTSWVRQRKEYFAETADAQTYESLKVLNTWVTQNYAPHAQERFFGAADFHLVGYAHAHGHIVVTHEIAANGKQVKIPNACEALGVMCCTPFEMLRETGAAFVWDAPNDLVVGL